MRLFGWFRRRRHVDEYVGRHRPGSWGEIALPPTDAPPLVDDPATVRTAPAPAVVVPPFVVEPPAVVAPLAVVAPPAVVEPPIAPRQRVRLGFADGTSVDIEDESGESDALRRAAGRLIDGPS